MILKRTFVVCLVLLWVGAFEASGAHSIMTDKLKTALIHCPKWIKLSVENTHFIWDLPKEKRPFLLQVESACYPGLLESRQMEILKDWVAQGNILWILFNPLRAPIPNNQDWAAYFGLKTSVATQSTLITKTEGSILPVRDLTDGVEVLQLGTPNIKPAYYSFEGNILPVLKTKEGQVVFGGQNFGAGRIIFDGFGWLFFEVEKDWMDPVVYDSEVFWVNFFKWARACIKPPAAKTEKIEMWVPPQVVAPMPVKKDRIDCAGLAAHLKIKFPKFEIKVQERSNGDCVFNLDRVLFDTGKAELREEGIAVLNEIVTMLQQNPSYFVRIAGHTDSKPIRGRLKKKFPNNWALSQARSQAVYRYFLEVGQIAQNRMTKEWFGDSRPVSTNKTIEGRQQNRRTEIILFISQLP